MRSNLIKPDNIFVLTAGRTGSVTFSRACGHITNFTSAHESRCHRLGEERLAYPLHHIEIDNRLSWFLGRLEKKYGDQAVYVYLTRDPLQIAQSYNKRWTWSGSIAMAYTRGILQSTAYGIEPCLDYVRTVSENIEVFLANKSRVFTIPINAPAQPFQDFWEDIGAEGDLDQALAEFTREYNPSDYYKNPVMRQETKEPKDKNAQKILELQEIITQFEKENAALKNTLARKIYLAIAQHIKSPSGWLKMPFILVKTGLDHKKERGHQATRIKKAKEE